MSLPAVPFLVVGVAAPWLWPWAPPPTPSATGMLAAWCMTALLWFITVKARSSFEHAGSLSTDPRFSASLGWLWVAFGLTLLAGWQMPVIDLALLGAPWGACLCIALAARLSQQLQSHPTLIVRQALAWGLLCAGLLSALIAGLQYSGVLREAASAWPWLHASPQEEAYGQLRQRNQFGSLMSLSLAAWFYLVHTGWPKRCDRWVAWLALAILMLGAVASASRTGALTWMALATLALLWPTVSTTRATSLGARAGAVTALLGFLALSWLLPRLINLAEPQIPKVSALERLTTQVEGVGVCESRVVLWRHVFELSLQKPWLGWGWGELDYVHATQAVSGERFCGQLGHAHNLLLQVAVEWGWPLALAGLLALGIWGWRRQPWRARAPAQVLGWSVAGVIGLHSLLEFPLWYGPFQMALGLSVGWIASGHASQSPQSKPAHLTWLESGLAALLLIGSLWATWDYHQVSQIYLPAHSRSSGCRQDPWVCANQVTLFHQGRDFARLMQQPVSTPELDTTQALAERVAHYAPEPQVLSRRKPPPLPNSPADNTR